MTSKKTNNKTTSTSAAAPPAAEGDETRIEMDAGAIDTVMFKQGDVLLGVGTRITLRGAITIQISQVPGELPAEVKVDLSQQVNIAAGALVQKIKKALVESEQLKLMVASSNQLEPARAVRGRRRDGRSLNHLAARAENKSEP
jgi:hypothetical protein